jgi:hypothetical protein
MEGYFPALAVEGENYDPTTSFPPISSQPFKRRRLLHNLSLSSQDASDKGLAAEESSYSPKLNLSSPIPSEAGGFQIGGRKRVISSMGGGSFKFTPDTLSSFNMS